MTRPLREAGLTKQTKTYLTRLLQRCFLASGAKLVHRLASPGGLFRCTVNFRMSAELWVEGLEPEPSVLQNLHLTQTGQRELTDSGLRVRDVLKLEVHTSHTSLWLQRFSSTS